MEYTIVLVLVVSILGSDITRADDHASCFDSIDLCTQDLKNLLLDEDMFWFGTDYATACKGNPTGTGCFNRAPDRLSILARMYNISDKAVLQKKLSATSLVDVQFPDKKGHYYGCGHTFQSSGKGPRIEPMKMTNVDSWTLDLEPTILWKADPGELYTVLVWDVGSFYAHGLYVNAKGGDLRSGSDVLDPYHGPVNTNPRPNVFVFTVFKQTTYINTGMVLGIWGKLLGMNMGALPVSTFLSDLSAMISELVAANVMTVPGDAYSFERQKNSYILNSCPRLITQSNDLKNILRAAGVNAIWTTPKKVLDYTEPSHLSTLTTELSVEYSMPRDLVVDSCCVRTTITRSLYRPDPLGTQATKPAVTSSVPRIGISPINILNDFPTSVRDLTYTLMMVDMTDASNLIIHWLVTDIKKADVSKGHEILPYLGPNPFQSDSPRVYIFFLLKQNDMLATFKMSDYTSMTCPDFLRDRCGADLSRMMSDLKIEDIAGITWFQAVQDAYARKRLYSELMVKTMVGVCDGQPGFEWPCPKDQYCARSTNSGTVLNGVSATVLSSLATVLTMLYCLVNTV